MTPNLSIFLFVIFFEQTVVKALHNQEYKLKDQVQKVKQDMVEIRLNIESMDINVPEPSPIGNGRSVCGHCHHRGHRNQATNPCNLKKCTDFTYCGKKDKHPEYLAKLNSLKLELRKKEKGVAELESQIMSIEQFSSSSEHQFIKNLSPRLYQADLSYKTNKMKLMRDIRLLREHFDGKIPPTTTNDAEQLKILIVKLKRQKRIEGDDDSFVESASTMQMSPVKMTETSVSTTMKSGKSSKYDSDSSSDSSSDSKRHKKRKKKIQKSQEEKPESTR